MSTTVVSLSLDKGVLKRIDDARGDVSRSRYVQRLIERELSRKKGGDPSPPQALGADTPPTKAGGPSNV